MPSNTEPTLTVSLERLTRSYGVYTDNTRAAGMIVYVPRMPGQMPNTLTLTVRIPESELA